MEINFSENKAKQNKEELIAIRNGNNVDIVDTSKAGWYTPKTPFKTITDGGFGCYSPDGQWLACASLFGTIKLYSLKNKDIVITLNFIGQHDARLMGFSPDSKILAVGSKGTTVFGKGVSLWNVDDGSYIRHILPEFKHLEYIAFVGENLLITFDHDQYVYFAKIWDIKKETSTGNIPCSMSELGKVTALCSSVDFSIFAVGGMKGVIEVFEMTGRSCIKKLNTRYAVTSLCFSPDSKLLASCSSTNTNVAIWDVANGSCVRSFQSQAGVMWTSHLGFGTQIMTFDLLSNIGVWDLASSVRWINLKLPTGRISKAHFSPDGRSLVFYTQGSTFKVWQVSKGQAILTLPNQSELPKLYSIPQKNYFVVASRENIQIWTRNECKVKAELQGSYSFVGIDLNEINGIIFILLTYQNGTVEIFNCQSGSEEYRHDNLKVTKAQFKSYYELDLFLNDGTCKVVYWTSPIKYAIWTNDVKLLENAYLLTKFDTGDSYLAMCLAHNAITCARFLLDNGYHDERALFEAVRIAIQKGKSDFSFLLEYLKSVDIQDEKRKTALHYAAKANNLHFASSLLRLGADRTIRDHNGYTPYHFAQSQEMKNLFDTFDGIISSALKGADTFDWRKDFKDYSRFALKWRNKTDGNCILHLALQSGNVEAIEEIIRICPDLLTVPNMEGHLPVQLVCSLSHARAILPTIFSMALMTPIDSLFDQLCLYTRTNIILMKKNDQFVYESIHPTMKGRLIKYQLDQMPTVLPDLQAYLESFMVYVATHESGILATVLNAFSSIQVHSFSNLKFASNLETEQFEHINTQFKQALSNPGITIDQISQITASRNEALKHTIDSLIVDLAKTQAGISKLDNYVKSLNDSVNAILKIQEDYSLTDSGSLGECQISDLEELGTSGLANELITHFNSANEIYNYFASSESKASPMAETEMARLLEVIPKMDRDSKKFAKSISSCITQKLNYLWQEIEKCAQVQLNYSTNLGRLRKQLESFEQISAALSDIASTRKTYESHRALVLGLEEKIVLLEFKIANQSRFSCQGLQEELDHLYDQVKECKTNREFVNAKRELVRRSGLLPELQLWYAELNPLNDLEIIRKYPTKDFGVEFTVEKELSPRVLLVKQAHGTSSVLKKFDQNQDRTLLRHAIEILGRLDHHPNILTLKSIVHATNDIMFTEHPYYPLGDLFEWRQSSNYDPTRLNKIFFDVVKGLQALHDSQILHRDIKPQNILISENGAVLADFDLSEFQVLQNNITFHSASIFPNTANFIAPEVLTTRKHTVESDLYSLGLTFAVALTGSPIQSKNDILNHDLSDDQRNLVIGLTKVSPEERTPLATVLKNPFVRGDFDCTICLETKMKQEGLFCQPEKNHFVCMVCFASYLESEVAKDISYLLSTKGAIYCPSVDECSGNFSFDQLCKETSPEVLALYLKGQHRVNEEYARRKERAQMQDMVENERKEQKELNQQLQEALLGDRQETRDSVLNYLRTEKMYEQDEYTRQCPNCRRVVQKVDGCNSMKCGQDYHGGNQQYGCGASFLFPDAPRYKSRVEDLDRMIQELTIPHLRRSELR